MGDCASRFGIVRDKGGRELRSLNANASISYSEPNSSRQKIDSQTLEPHPTSPKECQSFENPDFDDLDSIHSSVEEEMMKYASDIANSNAWVCHYITNFIRVRALCGSMYRDELPVLQISMNFSNEIPKELFISMLTDPFYRAKWDKYKSAIETLNEDPLIITYIFPFPVKNRRCIELIKVTKSTNEVSIISHSISRTLIYPEVTGFIHFSVITLRVFPKLSYIDITTQIDLQLLPSKRTEELLSHIGFLWANQLFNALSAEITK